METIKVLKEKSVDWNVSIGSQALDLLERKEIKGI